MTALGALLALPHAPPMPLACSGHLLIDLPIFMGPVLVLAGWLFVMTRRARRSERDEIESLPTNDPAIRDNLFAVQA